ncbi:N(2),N(2)-dimethylguanosine tRNA methyltransferase, mitochondrial [Wickerhamomyces ciferrii]|uniref:tRNA (guanine(26)-N(2))-dimethyltransferase n=1 Tax=Wickerhamomyces ciferrii (strain ATCC 14091 / BCRC 22168 / CBS 111 / JCM 3599 / NBRC 0793 / NRRL Y-1031 F-60-10) TaxID=1206466 RepID=K0KU94_WICCF|nr:N(2),N(2)-dimethylguanosine tRNA methyltransferase, mitochondrial [Wickerhamomyces ciferrii]CCH44999.1 N(2),N(2)-dimethylguanosine tRNA methyltransferase, mitochondrial [Wickerhamomyces ciferrii]
MNIFRSIKSFWRYKKVMSNVNPEDFNIVKEGKAEILFPKKEDVFYNPIQQFNRDLSTASIRAWSELYGIKTVNKKRKLNSDEPNPERVQPFINILEALSATGLRAIRYAKEIPNVKTIVANDFSQEAVNSINRNIEYNQVSSTVTSNKGDASAYMYETKAQNKLFNVIDLDPYGTATPFIDAAIQNISNEGLLLVTCTDLAVLAGNGYPEKCFALYGGTNLTGDAVHESALRLVLNSIGNTAAKYKKTIEPLLSLSIDFYVRVFIKVKTSPIEVKNLASKTMISYVCSGCGSHHNQPLGRHTTRENGTAKYSQAQGPPVGPTCPYCSFTNHLTGPMYSGPLHNKEFIQKVLDINKNQLDDDTYGTRKRIEGMLTLAMNEVEEPFYFKPEKVASIVKCQVPPLKTVIAGLGNLGYEASLTHAAPSAIKTNANWETIWFVFKQYIKQKAPNDVNKLNQNTAGYKILTNESIQIKDKESNEIKEVDFNPNELSGKVEKLRRLKIVRYQENPTKNWGPKAKPQ